MIALFLCATLLPYVAAAWLTLDRHGDADHHRFEVVVMGTGLLYAILNVFGFSNAITVPGVAAAGVAIAGVTWWHARRRSAGAADGPAPSDEEPVARGFDRWAGFAAAAGVAALCGAWVLISAEDLMVRGTDADLYHIPHAVNFALGNGPLGLRATMHTYPMGTSILFAWFIVPFGDAFVIEFGTLISFLVLLVSVAVIFRELTGQAGATWASWFVIAMMSLPLFQGAAQPSSDLSYTAFFLAVAAQLLWMSVHQAASMRDWAVLGLAVGMLVGCKTTGTYSAVLLLGAGAFVQLVTRWPRLWKGSRAWLWPLAVLAGTALLAGGLWLVRGVLLFGSPVEVVTDRYYGSMLKDLQEVYGGDWFYLLWRLRLKMAQWLGPQFLRGSAALAWMACEVVALAVVRPADRLNRTRAWFLLLTLAVVVVSLVGLVGAPWTSLEFTNGLSLRYALPLWMLLALLAFSALFSRWLAWYERPWPKRAGWVLLASGAIWCSRYRGSIGTLEVGAGWGSMLVATAAAGAVGWCVWYSRPGVRWRGDGWRPAWAAGALVASIALGAVWLQQRHAPLAIEAELRDAAEVNRWLDGKPPAVDPAYRQVYLEARADELARGDDCRARRFFVASRFDAPLALQPARYTSVLYETRGDDDRALKLLRHGAGPGVCEYVVLNRADADKRVVARVGVRPVKSSGEFLTFRVVRSGTRPGS